MKIFKNRKFPMVITALIALVMISLSFVAVVSVHTNTQTAKKTHNTGAIPASLTASGLITLYRLTALREFPHRGMKFSKGLLTTTT